MCRFQIDINVFYHLTTTKLSGFKMHKCLAQLSRVLHSFPFPPLISYEMTGLKFAQAFIWSNVLESKESPGKKKKSYKSQKNKAGFDDVLVFEAQKNNNKCFQCNFNINIKQICQ